MNPNQKFGVSRKMLETNIELFRSKVQLHQALLDAHIRRDLEERRFYYDLWKTAKLGAGVYGHDSVIPEPPYLSALKQFYKAHEDIIRVQLSELQAQLKMYEEMLREAERSIVVAGPGSVS
jgi:hypothetical protein